MKRFASYTVKLKKAFEKVDFEKDDIHPTEYQLEPDHYIWNAGQLE